MNIGWIKLYRQLLGSRVFNDANLLKVFIWCLLKASRKKRWIYVETGRSGIDVEILPGQFIFGRDSAARELKMKPSSVRNRIKKLEKLQNLDIQPDRQFSIISIVNWEAYQSRIKDGGQAKGLSKDRQGTGKGHKQECKKVKNTKIIPEGGSSISDIIPREEEGTPPKRRGDFFSDDVKNSDGTLNASEVFARINFRCNSILKLKQKKKPFNPKKWAQTQINSSKHPEAIIKALLGVELYWDTTRTPRAYCDDILKKYNGNFNEQETISFHKQLKDMPLTELSKISNGLLKSF